MNATTPINGYIGCVLWLSFAVYLLILPLLLSIPSIRRALLQEWRERGFWPWFTR